jgi:putative membrane protein
MKLATSGVIIGFGCLVSACASGGPSDQQRPSAQRQAPYGQRQLPGQRAASAATYVATASSIDLFEIRSSELAMQRSSNQRVREFATMMIAAHKGTASQLSLAGRRLNLLPSARLNARHEALLQALSGTSEFDATYRRQQAAVHQEALALHSAYAARGASPTLRPVAAAMVPIIQRHQRQLRYL